MKIKGGKELERKLKKLEKKEAKKIIKKAVREGQKVTLKQSRSNAQTMIGGEMGAKISKALGVVALRKQKKGSYSLQVGIKKSKVEEFIHNTADGIRYLITIAIEYGFRKKGGGTVQANPFMTNAADSTERKKLKKMISTVKKGLDSVT